MPYNESTGAGVPDRIKGDKKRRQWAAVWNSTYKETGDESRAFAAANSVYNESKKALMELLAQHGTAKVQYVNASTLVKFGTTLVGFVGSEFGPFKCATCRFSEVLGDESICVNTEVSEDDEVPEDVYGNKLIEPEACCNKWDPGAEEEESNA